MLKKTITYTDFNGDQNTEDFYFNLTRAELAEMELSGEGNSLKAQIEKIVASQNGGEIIRIFKEIIEKSYGVRSADGKRFMKTPAQFKEFASSEAYSELFMELATNADAGAAFINGLTAPHAQQQEQPGFRPGFDPSQRPTPPVAGAFGQPIEQAPDPSQAAQPIQQPPTIPPAQPYDPSQDRGPLQ